MGCPGILLGWMGSAEAQGHKGQAEERQGAGNGICSWHSCLLARASLAGISSSRDSSYRIAKGQVPSSREQVNSC